MATAPLLINWREGEFGDWPCTLGDARYNLHKVVLAAGSRGSGFFKGAFNDGFKAAGTDLAALLPASCHAYVESALDFVYGGEPTFTTESVLALCKIADVLSIDSLMEASLAALSSFRVEPEQFELALSLKLPERAVEALVLRTRAEDVLQVLAKRPAEPHLGLLLQACAKEVRIANVANLGEVDLRPGVGVRRESHVAFSQPGTQRLHRSPIGTRQAVCRVGILTWPERGQSIGVSRLGRGATFFGYPEDHRDFNGQVVKLSVNRPKRTLCFTMEKADGSEAELGSIYADFDSCDDLAVTVCASCPGTEYAVLQLEL